MLKTPRHPKSTGTIGGPAVAKRQSGRPDAVINNVEYLVDNRPVLTGPRSYRSRVTGWWLVIETRLNAFMAMASQLTAENSSSERCSRA